MTTFIYLCDTHLGADAMGYQQQRGYPEALPELFSLLGAAIRAHGGIDFVLHGGDLINRTDAASLEQAGMLAELPVPFYLCLGNHDVTVPDAASQWVASYPAFFAGQGPDFSLVCRDLVLHVAPTQWSPTLPPYYWERELQPCFLPAQVARLERQAEAHAHLPQIVCTHSPMFAVPTCQTGLAEPFHQPPAAFTGVLQDLCARHSRMRLVLGAHSHVNACTCEGGIWNVTAAAFSEVPFEYKIISVEHGRIRMSTETLLPQVSFAAGYNFNRTFVQGRACDRSLDITC